VEPGYLLFQRGRKIVAQAFDAETLAVSGDPSAVEDAPEIAEGVGTPALSASRTGHIAFQTPDDPRTRLAWLDGTTGQELKALDVEADDYVAPALSPDGGHVAIVRQVSPEESDIWILEVERLVMTRFTQGPGSKADPVWSPDGAYIAYSTDADGTWNLYKKPFTDGGPPEPLVVSPAPFKNPFDWSPDGKYLIYEQLGDGTNMDLWIAPTDGSGEPRPYVASVHQERYASFSPDGRWVAYMIFDSEVNVFVNSFPVPTQPHRVSIDGGTHPRWQADGKAIDFVGFRDGRGMLARASFQAEPLRTGIPEMIFEFATDLRGGTWTADGSRVLAMRAIAPPRDNTVTVVLNWERLLERGER
jgi:dipeptidyl aminopeptidase/acylaminoacyl peptidase